LKALFPHAATTRGVTVRVAVSYLPEQSHPAAARWFWAYHIRIENEGEQAVQLIARHWVIRDGNGSVHHVDGEGVVGDQPMIEPGGSYDYVSGCPLNTRSGSMEGHYDMVAEDGSGFAAIIPHFELVGPAVTS